MRDLVVDGSNVGKIAAGDDELLDLAVLREGLEALRSQYPGVKIVTVVDRHEAFRKRSPAELRAAVRKGFDSGEFAEAPVNVKGGDDGFILTMAARYGAAVVSNDTFRDHVADYPWLGDGDRLLGVSRSRLGWTFPPRATKPRGEPTAGRASAADTAPSPPVKKQSAKRPAAPARSSPAQPASGSTPARPKPSAKPRPKPTAKPRPKPSAKPSRPKSKSAPRPQPAPEAPPPEPPPAPLPALNVAPPPPREDSGMAAYVVAALLVCVVGGLFLLFGGDPREERARDALAVGVFEQTRDVDRVQLTEDETARVLDTMEEIEFREADGEALRSDLACGRIEAWRQTQKVPVDVCVLLEPESGTMLGSFDRVGSSPTLAGTRCSGEAVTRQVRCRAG